VYLGWSDAVSNCVRKSSIVNVENYRSFLEAIGHRVITSSSGHWFDISRAFYESIPPVRLIAPDREELMTLFRQHPIVGLKYCAPPSSLGRLSWIYLCRDSDYGMQTVHRKMRNKVRQGLGNCTVRPISFEYLHDHGMQLNRDTLSRQGRRDPMLTEPARWARLCQAGQRIAGACAWGAFVDGELAAYLIAFVINGCSNVLHQMSRTDLLDSKANNALAFLATRETIASPDIRAISYGHASIRGLPGLEEYKVRLGYEKWPMRYVVVLHPLIRFVLLNPLGDQLLGLLNRLLPGHDVLRRVDGILDIARESCLREPGTRSVAEGRVSDA
jgi:hypothetical protein